MTRADQEMDEYGKHVLAPLQQVPLMDPKVKAELKKQYLLQAENLRQGSISQTAKEVVGQRQKKTNNLWFFQHKPVMKALLAVLVALVVILAGSSFTVYAAQSSLPGEPLYPLKSWSESVRLSMTFSTKAKLNLTLDYTNRRVDEISSLLAGGKGMNDQTSDRLQRELDNALQLAAQLDDTQLQKASEQIKSHAENQGMTMEELISTLPPQAEPAIRHLQERLNEQVQLSSIGESDPKAFRMQIRERAQKRYGPNPASDVDQPQPSPTDLPVTPVPGKNDKGNGNQGNQSTDTPGHGGQGGKEQSTPESGNHGPDESQTPKP